MLLRILQKCLSMLKARRMLLALFICVLQQITAQTLGPPKNSSLIGSGQLSKAKVRNSESIPFWITLKNSGPVPVKSIRLAQFPEFDYTACIVNPSDGKCSPVAAGTILVPVLNPDQTYTSWGELAPKSEHATQKLAFVLGWSVNDSPSFTAVSLGENAVQSDWEYYWDRWLGGTVKTLAVPAALALLAFMLDWLTKRREARQRQAEKSEEKTETQRATEQAVATETWKQMLPLSHKYAGTLYLPISSAAEDAIDAFGDKTGQAAFFYILLLLKRIDLAKKAIGGLYFKSYTGEDLAQLCWRRFRAKFLGEDTDKFLLGMHRSAKLLEGIDHLDEFESKYLDDKSNPKDPELKGLFIAFDQRRLNKTLSEESIAYLRGFFSILDYEANRPYQYWYNTPALLKTTAETLELLKRLAAEKKLESADEYFKNVKIV